MDSLNLFSFCLVCPVGLWAWGKIAVAVLTALRAKSIHNA